MRSVIFPSYQLDGNAMSEELDQRAFRDYLIREKLCENLDDAPTSPINIPNASSSSSSPSYWDHAISKAALVISHIMRSKQHNAHVKTSTLPVDGDKVYKNLKNIKALCIKGKQLLSVSCLVGKYVQIGRENIFSS